MPEEEYFVQIKDPVDIRKSLLGGSKQIIQMLQRYEHIKTLRTRKLEKISKLRSINKEINLLTAKLQKEFPEFKMRVALEDDAPRKRRASARGDDLAKLESELKMIEDKIGRLS